MDETAVVVTLEGIESSVAALGVVIRGDGAGAAGGDPAAAGVDPLFGADSLCVQDPLRNQADAYLDGLEELGRMEARLAALKVQFTAGYAAVSEAMAARARSPQECMAHKMAVTAEVACVLTVSERAADALLSNALTMVSGLPLTLAALQTGNISWQHARILCDETANLEPAAATALEAHFLGAFCEP